MKILIDIPEETYDYWKEHKYEYVLSEAIANGIVFPSNPTNGDMIKVLFPNEYDFETDFDEKWWNEPYGGDKDEVYS